MNTMTPSTRPGKTTGVQTCPTISRLQSIALACIVVALGACANNPPPPGWLLTADAALTAHARYRLEGRDTLAAGQLKIARNAVRRTGDASQMGKVELHACAVAVASLETGDCPGFAALAEDAGASERAYADYLAQRTVNPALLPEMQRRVWQNPNALAEVSDPLSRLVAAGVLLRAGRLAPAGISVAIDTAAAQGWRRPLLAWLTLERERLVRAGDEAGAAAIERRIERIVGTAR